MQIIIDRDRVAGKWTVSAIGGRNMVTFDADDARGAVRHIQALFPAAQVGVKSTVFGPATVMAYGPVVWMKENLS